MQAEKKLLALNAVLAVKKPSGPSSSQVVQTVKSILMKHYISEDISKKEWNNIFRRFRVGHGGTLDPMADGVLVIGINSGCKELASFLKCSKTYIASAKFGFHYDTLDITGTLLSVDQDLKYIDKTSLENACSKWVGRDLMQKPPSFSAIRLNGKRAYEIARNCTRASHASENLINQPAASKLKCEEPVEMQARPVTIYSIEILRIDHPFVSMKFEVSGGTYIRSLIRDIAIEIGTVATMSSLSRTAQGRFSLTDAVEIEKITENLYPINAA